LTPLGLQKTSGVTYSIARNGVEHNVIRSDGLRAVLSDEGIIKSITADFNSDGITDTAGLNGSTWTVTRPASGSTPARTGTGATLKAAVDSTLSDNSLPSESIVSAALNTALTSVGLQRSSGVTYSIAKYGASDFSVTRSDGISAVLDSDKKVKSITADFNGDGVTDTATLNGSTWTVNRTAVGSSPSGSGTGSSIAEARDAANSAVSLAANPIHQALNAALSSIGLNRTSGVTYNVTRTDSNGFKVIRSDGLEATLNQFYGVSLIKADFNGDGTSDRAFLTGSTWTVIRNAAGNYSSGMGTGSTIAEALNIANSKVRITTVV
jgi:hypothetical protein